MPGINTVQLHADMIRHVLFDAEASTEPLDALLAEIERLQWIEIRCDSVKKALEGKTIVDAATVRRCL